MTAAAAAGAGDGRAATLIPSTSEVTFLCQTQAVLLTAQWAVGWQPLPGSNLPLSFLSCYFCRARAQTASPSHLGDLGTAPSPAFALGNVAGELWAKGGSVNFVREIARILCSNLLKC